MRKTQSFKIFMCLILTVITAVFWMYIWSSLAADVGQTTYEDAVFVDRGSSISEGFDGGYLCLIGWPCPGQSQGSLFGRYG